MSDQANPLDEQALLDAQSQQRQLDANAQAVRDKARQALADMQTIVDTANQDINAGPAPYIKAIARAVRLLIRIALRIFDGTD